MIIESILGGNGFPAAAIKDDFSTGLECDDIGNVQTNNALAIVRLVFERVVRNLARLAVDIGARRSGETVSH